MLLASGTRSAFAWCQEPVQELDLAVAASMLTAAYHMLKNGVEYRDLGADHFSRRDRSKAIQRLVRRLYDMGCEVQLTPLAA